MPGSIGIAEYDERYVLAESLRPGRERRPALRRSSWAWARSWRVGGHAFTDTFQDLHLLSQLPGIAVQRLMEQGYGFGAEGDWKTAALVRAMKVMAGGLRGGTSFMEDYPYDFGRPAKVLGAHMLEVCPFIAAEKPSCEIHPLSIGGKSDPVRLVFTAPEGRAVNASVVQVGNRFRMIVNEVNVVRPDRNLPCLPVARAVWVPIPDLATAAAARIYAGGAHHTGSFLAGELPYVWPVRHSGIVSSSR
jgi:L-arabinose isomerase